MKIFKTPGFLYHYKFKDMLIAAILADSHTAQDTIFDQMIDDIKDEVLPIRPERYYKRKKGLTSSKFHNNRKHTF